MQLKQLISNLFFKKYKIVQVNSKDLLQNLFKYRYHIYCEVDKLLDEKKYPNKCEFDEYDAHSVHFVAIDKNEKIIGTIRIIKHSDLGFPTEKEFNLKIISKEDLKKSVEISRLMIDKEYRKTLLSIDLYKTIYKYSINNGIEYWIGCLELWLFKKIKTMIKTFEFIDKPVFCFNAYNYPFKIKLTDIQKYLKHHFFMYLYFL